MRKDASVLLAAAALGLASCPTAQAWGAAGHEIVATIAQIYLHPTTLATVCDILYPDSPSSSAPCQISRIAAWADRVRRLPTYRYTASHHYVGATDDHPGQSCTFPGSKGWAGKQDQNVLGAVRNKTTILVGYADGSTARSEAEEAIKFLVHYVGDMHMPLHLTGRERGGNGARVQFDGRATNLHSLWDSLLIAQSLRTIPNNYTVPFPPGSTAVDVEKHLRDAIYDPYIRRIMYEGMGVGAVDGRFEADIIDWLSCPAREADAPAQSQWQWTSPQALWSSLQTTLGLRSLGDETRWDDDYVCPYAWARELHQLNCKFPIWPRELDFLPYNETQSSGGKGDTTRPHPDLLELNTPQYAGRLRHDWVIERLLATAGIRLAGLLNGLFMIDGGSDGAALPVLRLSA